MPPPRRFFIAATTLVGLLHFYIGVRLLPCLPISSGWRLIGGAWLVVSSGLIPLGLLTRGIKRQPLADRMAWVGFFAMGLFSSLLVFTVLRDLILFALFLFGHLATPLPAPLITRLSINSAMGAVVLAALVTAIGFWNARRVASVVHVDIPFANLPPGLHGFTIAQLSDVHVGPTIKRDYLERIVTRVNTLNADLIAITGDLVDGSVAHLSSHTEPLSKLHARHGSFFVTGNHEYYSNAHEWIDELRRLGLHVLLNEHVVLLHQNAQLVVAGVTDFSGGHFDSAHRSDPHIAIANAPHSAIKLLLAHQPRSAKAAVEAGFDLQLSGHTHGGQFWPWNFFVPLQQPYTAGLHKLHTLWIYVSRGTGYWGPPKRFGAPSEITLIRLVRA